MNETWALNLIRETFENSFDRERFLIFAKNLFHFLDTDAFIYRGNLIPDAYDSHIKTLERIGKYEDAGGNKIDVLAVCLNKQSSLERARALQRNFIAWYLNGSRGGVAKDAALVAFYTKDSGDWRLSLVKMDYHLGESKTGKIKTITELTPARRFSFLVGADENTHTAQRQLLPILKDTEFKPTLSDLELAFSVEVVTKDFFEKYKKLFLDAKEALDKIVAKDAKIKSDFQEKNIDTADFAKKLLGQIVFLYFLQKKGWFGVARDEDWGTGSKTFLRDLFDGKVLSYKNFFNNVLEPLFYDALARDRSDVDYFNPQFNCKIPFLNGGLFDPLGGYDWTNTDIYLPNNLFSSKKSENDEGSGILDIFDLYNFTVREDEPLEREVAVDPEMLGKVFENLLEVKDRKSKGTYYTPREIVHYMCQESLINYLLTELSHVIPSEARNLREDIETLIRLGETAIENETLVMDKGFETKDHHFKLPQSIRQNANLIDEKLEKIHVCDPAVGSGAFLVGMMTEIIRTRNVLTPYLSLRGSEATKQSRSVYDFKRHAIQNCLYGVDIDPGAVEIAKLRLWLSLIVDEQDIKQIKPLPNLDYKIMVGNSLIELLSPVLLSRSSDQKRNKLIDELSASKNAYTTAYDMNRKRVLREKINSLIQVLVNYDQQREKDKIWNQLLGYKGQIKIFEDEPIQSSFGDIEQKLTKKLRALEKIKDISATDHFEWHLNFNEVFNSKDGFDVVIANPPYVRADSKDPSYQEFRRTLVNSGQYKTLYEKWDLFVPFIERGLNLLNKNGDLDYIVSNAVCTSKYAFKLLDLIQEEYFVVSIDYFENMQVFEAGVVPVVLHISKSLINQPVRKIIRNESFDNVLSEQEYKPDDFKKLGKLAFKKDYHEINIKVSTINLGDICYMSVGMVLNADEKRAKGEFKIDDLISDVKTDINIKPYIEAKNIDNYLVKKIRYLEWDTKRCPAKIRRKTFPELYERPKLMVGSLTGGIYDDSGLYTHHGIVNFVRFADLKGVNNKSISGSIQKFNSLSRGDLEKKSEKFDLKFLLAIINSRFADTYLNNIRRHRLENYFYPDDFRNLPIAEIPLDEQKLFADLVDNITNLKKSDSEKNKQQVIDYEKQIDQLVYQLYGLTPEEIAIVEGTNEDNQNITK